jgi:flavin reductase (DIM6/NTAB) family NADH-FMN oxidoreductase RutF
MAAILVGGGAGGIGEGIVRAQCAWRRTEDGTPILETCDYLVGRVAHRFDCGDHTAHVLDVVEVGSVHPQAPQLGFQSVRDIRPGHPP